MYFYTLENERVYMEVRNELILITTNKSETANISLNPQYEDPGCSPPAEVWLPVLEASTDVV